MYFPCTNAAYLGLPEDLSIITFPAKMSSVYQCGVYTLCSETNTIYIYISSDIYSVIYCLIYHVISHGFPMLAANTLAARPWASESWPRPLQIRWADHILRIHRYQPKDLMLGGFHKFDINGGTPK